MLYPAVIQRLIVQPAELDRERLYIEHNIRLTRLAYRLDKIQEARLPEMKRVILSSGNRTETAEDFLRPAN